MRLEDIPGDASEERFVVDVLAIASADQARTRGTLYSVAVVDASGVVGDRYRFAPTAPTRPGLPPIALGAVTDAWALVSAITQIAQAQANQNQHLVEVLAIDRETTLRGAVNALDAIAKHATAQSEVMEKTLRDMAKASKRSEKWRWKRRKLEAAGKENAVQMQTLVREVSPHLPAIIPAVADAAGPALPRLVSAIAGLMERFAAPDGAKGGEGS